MSEPGPEDVAVPQNVPTCPACLGPETEAHAASACPKARDDVRFKAAEAREEARKGGRERWRRIKAVAEVLGISPGRIQYAQALWGKLREDEVGILARDPAALERARVLLRESYGLDDGAKRIPPSTPPIPRGSVRAPSEEIRQESTGRGEGGKLARVRLMLWAIRQCGSLANAKDAWERAVRSLED